jgi:hypothetical protein
VTFSNAGRLGDQRGRISRGRIAERELSGEAGMGSWESAYKTLMPNAADSAQLGKNGSIISLYQMPLNQRVQGSSPCAPTKLANDCIYLCGLLI